MLSPLEFLALVYVFDGMIALIKKAAGEQVSLVARAGCGAPTAGWGKTGHGAGPVLLTSPAARNDACLPWHLRSFVLKSYPNHRSSPPHL